MDPPLFVPLSDSFGPELPLAFGGDALTYDHMIHHMISSDIICARQLRALAFIARRLRLGCGAHWAECAHRQPGSTAKAAERSGKSEFRTSRSYAVERRKKPNLDVSADRAAVAKLQRERTRTSVTEQAKNKASCCIRVHLCKESCSKLLLTSTASQPLLHSGGGTATAATAATVPGMGSSKALKARPQV